MHTVATDLNDQKRLAGFFFFPPTAKAAETLKVLPTIAFRLSKRCPAYRDALGKHVVCDISTSLAEQFELLFVKCLKDVNPSDPPPGGWTVVIDAFDQCTGDEKDELRRNLTAISSVYDSDHLKSLPIDRPHFTPSGLPRLRSAVGESR